MSAISVTNLTKAYGTNRVLKGLTFDVQPGEIFALLGQNGAGKTTTLDIIEGLRPADGGSVVVLGVDMMSEPKAAQARIGVQLQSTSLIEDFTAAEQIALFARLYRATVEPAAALERVGLTDKARVRPDKLSGGEKQRLVLALALVNDPDILFLDEPTAGLDVQSRRRLWSIVREWQTGDRAVVLTTHYIEEAEQLAHRVGILHDGVLAALDTPHALIAGLQADAVILLDGDLPPALTAAVTSATTTVHENGLTRIQTPEPTRTYVELAGLAEEHNIRLGSVRIQHPSLEDVFVSLTGRSITHDD
ncbi:MAG: ABC transporter ATP-binding protein [Chloroflexi bacterium]|nr:ABC transporter ATP-binding protein [Chloroflexota bacterium]